jgi:hypothetical protein
MKQAVQASPVVSLEHLDPEELQLVRLCCEATTVTVHDHGSHAADHYPYSTLRNIVFSGQRYGDKVASCSCSAMRLFKFSDEVYTVCVKHGLQHIGALRREIVNGMARSTGHVNGRKHA